MNRQNIVRFLMYFAGGIVLGLGVYFLFIRDSTNPILEFATVRDSFTDVTAKDAAVVYFVRVKSYDSLQIRAAADYFMKQDLAKPEFPVAKHRTMLMHFFVEGDTASLSADMLDELAYTHPEVADPHTTLMLVPGGYVMKVEYKEGATTSSTSELKRTPFYMARPGIQAKDLR